MNNFLKNSNSKFLINLFRSLRISCVLIATVSCIDNAVNKINKGNEKSSKEPIFNLDVKEDKAKNDEKIYLGKQFQEKIEEKVSNVEFFESLKKYFEKEFQDNLFTLENKIESCEKNVGDKLSFFDVIDIIGGDIENNDRLSYWVSVKNIWDIWIKNKNTIIELKKKVDENDDNIRRLSSKHEHCIEELEQFDNVLAELNVQFENRKKNNNSHALNEDYDRFCNISFRYSNFKTILNKMFEKDSEDIKRLKNQNLSIKKQIEHLKSKNKKLKCEAMKREDMLFCSDKGFFKK